MIDREVSKQLTINKPTRVAVLDLGTNTFHLLIADIAEMEQPQILYRETIAVRLGEGGISEGRISGEAVARGINAIKLFRSQIDRYEAKAVKTVATSAIRSASNGNEFIENIKSETGLIVEIIDGEREAELIYKGVREAVKINMISLIVDIGGGSVEFIICDANTLLWKKSYSIGAARLMEKFHDKDPITIEGVRKLHAYLDKSLTDLSQQMAHYKPSLMIGSAGSFETFAKFQDPDFELSFDKPEKDINLELFSKISERIIKSTHAEREQMTAIPTVRVDMIVVSTILTSYIIERFKISKLKLSTYSLKEGLLFETGK